MRRAPISRNVLLALAAAAALSAAARAQTGLPSLLRDIAPSPSPNWGQLVPGTAVFVPLGGELYFAGWDLTEGLELRATDGTAAGTRTVRDVCPGSCGGFYGFELVESGGVLYFVGDDPVHGRELWRSDGTRAGTYRLSEVLPGGDHGASPGFLTPAPGGIYFAAVDIDHGEELWWSDGTPAGTHLVADVQPGAGPQTGDGPSHLTWLAGRGLVFVADDGTHGRELWLTQGTAATTQMLADVRPGAASGLDYYQAYPDAYAEPAVAGSKVYFTADDGSHGRELWATDGTAAGTGMVADLAPGLDSSHPSNFFPFGSDLLFGAYGPGFTRPLWRTNGTAAGTVALGDAAHGSQDLNPVGYGLLGGVVYFAGSSAATGRELWRTDGTLAGTQLAVDIRPGPDHSIGGLRGFTAAAGRLWFPADDGVHGIEWWQSDGTVAGTFLVADLMPGAAAGVDPFSGPFPRAIGGHVLLLGYDPDRAVALRAGEPGVAGAPVVWAAGDRAGSMVFCTLWNCPATVTPVTGGVAFAAFDGPHGGETWRSDGTEAGTRLVADIAPGPYFSTYYWPAHARAAFGDDLLLVASDCGTSPCEDAAVQLRRADAAGNVTALTAEPWSVAPGDLAAWNGAGYLAAENGLWKSDGSAAGTAPLSAAAVGAHWFAPGSDALYFAAGALWRSDGTGIGTAALNSGFDYGLSAPPVVTGDGSGHDRVYFGAADAAAGNELWTSDGTDAGTRRVVDLRPGPAGSMPTVIAVGLEEIPLLAAVGPNVFFAADDGVAGEELWMSNGSPANAALLEVRPGPLGSQPRWLTPVGSQVYFAADDGVHGVEPWVSDGTPAGTHLVADIRAGVESSSPRELAAWMGRLVFAADDDVHGMELWRADPGGTGAQLVTDLRPGAEPSSPQGMTAVGERLYFFADDGVTGLEPWVWSAANEVFADGFETGAVARWSRAFSF
ncbi:MAG TPA: ELWxxDGT repeat protein [Thermoanaerobaculia bacterium]|jgi:ELWxxDGT repeat protein|nr:ELWxxDGT repeat protein [Thermoanaerobaculia bacterium]